MGIFKIRFDEAVQVRGGGIGHELMQGQRGEWQTVEATDIAAADTIACDMAEGRQVYVTIRSVTTEEERFFLFPQNRILERGLTE